MNRQEYEDKSKTPGGRKAIHDEMIDIIQMRMDALLQNAPEANRSKIEYLFKMAMNSIKEYGNSMLFDFYADEKISDKEFARNIQNEIYLKQNIKQ